MSTAPVLSPRALQELMKGKHANFVSVKVEDEVVLRVHRPVAVRFSPVWNRELGDHGRIVTVTFPPDPAPAPANSANVPPPPPRPSYKSALKFVVQWMDKGGADPVGYNAVPYPNGYREGLERLLTLANMLEIGELHARVKRDLGAIPVLKPKICSRCQGIAHPGKSCHACSKCKRIEHPGKDCETCSRCKNIRHPRKRCETCPNCQRIVHPGKDCQTCYACHEVGHFRHDCPKARQEYLERVARRARKAENDKQIPEWEDKRRKKWEKAEERRVQWEVKKGLRALGSGKTLLL